MPWLGPSPRVQGAGQGLQVRGELLGAIPARAGADRHGPVGDFHVGTIPARGEQRAITARTDSSMGPSSRAGSSEPFSAHRRV